MSVTGEGWRNMHLYINNYCLYDKRPVKENSRWNLQSVTGGLVWVNSDVSSIFHRQDDTSLTFNTELSKNLIFACPLPINFITVMKTMICKHDPFPHFGNMHVYTEQLNFLSWYQHFSLFKRRWFKPIKPSVLIWALKASDKKKSMTDSVLNVTYAFQ